MNVEQETLGLRRAGFSPALTLLMSAFALPIPPAALARHLRRPTERSATTSEDRDQESGIRTAAREALQHAGDLGAPPATADKPAETPRDPRTAVPTHSFLIPDP